MADVLDLPFFQMLNVIGERFPQYIPILSKPGVFAVLEQAINENWTPDRIFTALQDTDYFRSTNDQQRAWDILVATNPGTAQQKVADYDRQVKQAVFNLGIQLNPTDQLLLTLNAARYGWDANRIMSEVVGLGHPSGGTFQTPGLIASKMTELNGIADQYGVQVDPQALYWSAANIAGGVHPQEQWVEQIRQQAMGLFPAIAPFLANGGTVQQYAQPYFQMATQELGINPNQIDLRSPQWQDLFITRDGKGNQGVRSMQDALVQLRSNPTYGYDGSTPGRTEAGQLSTQLGQMFGALG